MREVAGVAGGELLMMKNLLMALLVLGTMATVPNGAAHECDAHFGCDADEETCPDGEDHSHTDRNIVRKDKHCSSKSKDPQYCMVAGKRFPDGVCKILEKPQLDG